MKRRGSILGFLGLILLGAAAISGYALPGADSPQSPTAKREGTAIVMNPFGVAGKPVGSFGFSVQIMKDGLSQKVITVTVDGVAPNSDGARKGLKPLTRILKIDGRDVRDFVATFTEGSDMNRKLMNRKPGDRVTLEIVPLGSPAPTTITLVEREPVNASLRSHSDFEDDNPNANYVRVGNGR